jgi:hypothetical protein
VDRPFSHAALKSAAGVLIFPARSGMHHTGDMPSVERLRGVLDMVGVLVGHDECYAWRRAFHFPFGGGDYTLAISPDSADRIRLDLCLHGVPLASLWSRCDDDVRLARLVAELLRAGDPVGA